MGKATELISGWKERAAGATVFSPLEVQDRLFELYDEVPEPALDLVKEWLQLTIERELFGAAELELFLAELEVAAEQPA